MASNINPTNIDGNYPVAGQDNDSQGFRDNFTNIKNNLQFAKTELDDLQSKVLLKSALTGGTLSNDMAYATLYRMQAKAQANSFRDLGTVNGPIAVSFLDAMVQKITTSGPLVLSLEDFPASGVEGRLRLWISVTFGPSQTSAVVKFPNSVTLGIGALSNFNSGTREKTFTAAGDYLFELMTVDGGANYWLLDLI
jgi:hypothetical protein